MGEHNNGVTSRRECTRVVFVLISDPFLHKRKGEKKGGE